jgi:hypothetical protein
VISWSKHILYELIIPFFDLIQILQFLVFGKFSQLCEDIADVFAVNGFFLFCNASIHRPPPPTIGEGGLKYLLW